MTATLREGWHLANITSVTRRTNSTDGNPRWSVDMVANNVDYTMLVRSDIPCNYDIHDYTSGAHQVCISRNRIIALYPIHMVDETLPGSHMVVSSTPDPHVGIYRTPTKKKARPMRILITGSRELDTNYTPLAEKTLETVIAFSGLSPENITLVHGAARGADTMLKDTAQSLGIATESHPAQWDVHGRAAGPIRNQHMVDLGADLCLAFPLGASRGTRHAMSAADKAGIPVINMTESDRPLAALSTLLR